MRDENAKVGTLSRIITFSLRGTSDGQLLAGKVAADFSGTWHRAGGTSVALSFAAGSPGDAYSSGKIVPLGDGSYDWHVPDALYSQIGNVVAVINCADAFSRTFEFEVGNVDRTLVSWGASTHSAADVRNLLQAVADDFKADVTGLLDDADKAELLANIIAQFDGAGDLPVATIRDAVVSALLAQKTEFHADVSGLSTFDPLSQTVNVGSVAGVAVTGVSDFHATVWSAAQRDQVLTEVATVAAEVVKIPRKATAINAGDEFTFQITAGNGLPITIE